MWHTFNRIGLGRVLEIDCPTKRDRLGRRFGFVRFLDVKNEAALERRLNEVRIGSRILQANKPRYTKWDRQKTLISNNRSKAWDWRQQSPYGNGRRPSYAEVVKAANSRMEERSNQERRKEGTEQRHGNNGASVYGAQQREWKPKHQHQHWSSMELNVDLKEYAWLEKCFVGTVHSVNSISNLQQKFYMEGIFFTSIRPMGGRLVLLEAKEHEDLKELVDTGKDWLGKWFADVKPWTPTVVVAERFAWIRYESTISKERLDIARFLISTPSMESISKSITVKINGEFFTLMFTEEESTNNLFTMRSDRTFHTPSEEEEESSSTDNQNEVHSDSDENIFEQIVIQSQGIEDDDVAILRAEVGDDVASPNMGDGNKHEVATQRDEVASPNMGDENENNMASPKAEVAKHIDEAGCSKRNEDEEASTGTEIVQETEGPKKHQENKSNRPKARDRKSEISFWDDLGSDSGTEARWMNRNDGCGKRKKKRRAKSCASVYRKSGGLDGFLIQQKNKGQKKSAVETKKKILFEKAPEKSIADNSINDSNIQNCNKSIEMRSRKRNMEALWSWVKELGVSAQTEEISVLQKLVDMESRDKARWRQEEEKKNRKGDQSVDKRLCRMIWDSDNFEWVAQPANGASGGILTIWNSTVFKKISILEGAGYLGVVGFWGEENIPCYLVNVYSSCDLVNKRILWENLSNLICSNKGNWCIAGDFNVIRNLQERKGGISVRRELREFNEFIEMCGLVDLPLIGRKFTWYQPNGNCMSRLDRFLFSEEWLLNWTELKQWGLPRTLLDHCPILVKDETRNWGPKPFKFFNVWLQDHVFREMTEKQWNSFNIQGWGGYVLKEKLKLLKNSMKEWTRSHVQEVDKKIEEAKDNIAKLDCKGELQQLTEEESSLKRDLLLNLWENIQKKEEMARQKSRMMWMKEGDANTSFFHRCIKSRWRRNEINSLMVNGKTLHEVEELKQGVTEYFKNLFTAEDWKRPILEGVHFNKISETEKGLLTEPFLEAKVKAAVWNCDSDKAPGPDGLSFGFLKAEWEVVKKGYNEVSSGLSHQ
ncbi:hypothetical protein SLEP1_g36982 [Rubroshorea leprosula]|uniref:Endonuclease/exonuclease/phosphatase domain-containing protein n=1 Tax=Rubroshorea leprosula TaxID=152421 RepID=A0AAV5KTR0_9ROSI|nr:hypothetical protein SLEP1_g36982 [Rubroshorea leprosula]